MGRRSGGGGIDVTSSAWEAVRRTLGRLFTHSEVRALGADRMNPPVRISPREALAMPLLDAGAREHAWEPTAIVSETAVPRCDTGTSSENLLPVVHLAVGNYALMPPECGFLPPLSAAFCRVEAAVLACLAEVTRLPPEFLRLPVSPVLVQTRPVLTKPNVAAWSIARLKPPQTAAARIPRLSVTVRMAGDAILSRMAVTRLGREAPPGMSADLAFEAERQRLAETAGLSVAEVTLLGVYPGVPILAVRRLVVEEEGRRLRLWLKPEVLRGRGARRLITLLVGRRSADGKMLQAAL